MTEGTVRIIKSACDRYINYLIRECRILSYAGRLCILEDAPACTNIYSYMAANALRGAVLEKDAKDFAVKYMEKELDKAGYRVETVHTRDDFTYEPPHRFMDFYIAKK